MIIHPPIRKVDEHGMGHYHAPRGDRLHNGVDVACYAGSVVCAVDSGTVTKIGSPYYYENPRSQKERLKNKLRYVQITTVTGLDYRYFYVEPRVEVGQAVLQQQVIGEVQDIQAVFGQNMTGHVHVEIKQDGNYINPTDFVFPLVDGGNLVD